MRTQSPLFLIPEIAIQSGSYSPLGQRASDMEAGYFDLLISGHPIINPAMDEIHELTVALSRAQTRGLLGPEG